MRHKAQPARPLVNLDCTLLGRIINSAYLAETVPATPTTIGPFRRYAKWDGTITASTQTSGQRRIESNVGGALWIVLPDGRWVMADRYIWQDKTRQYVNQQRKQGSHG